MWVVLGVVVVVVFFVKRVFIMLLLVLDFFLGMKILGRMRWLVSV